MRGGGHQREQTHNSGLHLSMQVRGGTATALSSARCVVLVVLPLPLYAISQCQEASGTEAQTLLLLLVVEQMGSGLRWGVEGGRGGRRR